MTSVPDALLTPAEAAVLYRARWQIEIDQADYRPSDRLCLGGIAA